MQTRVKYCRRCHANTNHWRKGIGRRAPWSMVLLYVLASPLRRWLLDPWVCELCEVRRSKQRGAIDHGTG
jgi:hypothetical protein